MSFNEGDRVHIHGRSDYLGTVTADRDSMFPSMCGVRWADGEFAFVNPIKLAHVDPVAIPGMTEHERQALGTAYQRALDAVDPIGFVTATNVHADWQTRAEQAEAKLKAAKRVAKQHMNRADKAKAKVAAVEALTDHYAALIETMPKPHGVVTQTQAIFVRDVRTALDADR